MRLPQNSLMKNKMCTVCYLCLIAYSVLTTNANILNDLQEAQKFMEQLDYDYSVAAADQPKPSELLWYDYGGSGSGDNYYGGQISAVGDKRAGGSTQSNSGIWFGPRLGRRKRHGGFSNVQQVPPIDATVIGPEVLIGQPSVADLIENAPWAVLVPIIDSTLYNGQSQKQQNARNGRSSSEDGTDEPSSRHTARSPPYSPPFSPRLGRQVSLARPQVPRLGRDVTQLYARRDARSASTYLQQQQQRQLRQTTPVATKSAAAARTGHD